MTLLISFYLPGSRCFHLIINAFYDFREGFNFVNVAESKHAKICPRNEKVNHSTNLARRENVSREILTIPFQSFLEI